MPTLINSGYLVPPVSFKTERKCIEDDDTDEQLIKIVLPELVRKLHQIDRSKILVFCKNISHVQLCHKHLSELMPDWLITQIHSHLSVSKQDRAYLDFDQAEKSILINCSMLTTGVDLPFVDTIVILRRISSIALYVQIVGRGLRVSPGKTDCAIFDYGYNNRYGYIDNIIMDKNDLKQGKTGLQIKTCTECGALNNVNVRQCVYCGQEFNFKHVLSDHASGDSLLSNNLRLSLIVNAKSVKQKNVFKHVFYLENGETVIDFSKLAIDLCRFVGKRIVYEKLGTINRKVNIL